LNKIVPGSPAFAKALTCLFAGGFVSFSILYSTQPLLPLFSHEFHVKPVTASLSVSLSTGMLAVFMLLAASLSDSWGRKKMMNLSLLCSSVLALLLPFLPNFTLLLIFRALTGAALAGLPSIAMTYINEEFHPQSLGRVMGIYIAGTSIGGMSGRIAVGILSDLFSWQTALTCMGLFNLLLSCWFWKHLPESAHFHPKRLKLRSLFFSLVNCLKNPGLLLLYGISFALMGSFVSLYNYIGYDLMASPYHLSSFAVSLIFIVYLTGTFSSAWMGRLADKWGQAKVLGFGIFLMLISDGLSLYPHLISKIIAVAIFTFGFFGSHSVASGGVGKLAAASKAQASSLYLFFYYTGSSLAGSAGGWFWSRFGWFGVTEMIGCLLLVSLGLVFLLFLLREKPKPGRSFYKSH
jgi:YNFM family putative membrane transporter